MEAAILSVTPAEVETMAQAQKRFSKSLQIATTHLNRSITTTLILNNIMNIGGSILVGQLTIRLFGNASLGIMTTGLTFGIIVFSEIIPKSIATRHALIFSRYASPFIITMNMVFLPLVYPLEKTLRIFTRGERTIGTEAQIRSLVRIGRRGGHIKHDEGQLIHRVFSLNDITAKDIMTPREHVVALPSHMPINEAAATIIADPHSRFPVYENNLDSIRGIILEAEVLAGSVGGDTTSVIGTYARPAHYVSPDERADDLLIRFKNERSHMVIVRGPDGNTLGIVTLEDVLEELVGEIEDERDDERNTTSAK